MSDLRARYLEQILATSWTHYECRTNAPVPEYIHLKFTCRIYGLACSFFQSPFFYKNIPLYYATLGLTNDGKEKKSSPIIHSVAKRLEESATGI